MKQTPLYARVLEIRKRIKSFGEPSHYRKLYSILDALEMQVEDGEYPKFAVIRLCEALLVSSEFHEIDGEDQERLEALISRVAEMAES